MTDEVIENSKKEKVEVEYSSIDDEGNRMDGWQTCRKCGSNLFEIYMDGYGTYSASVDLKCSKCGESDYIYLGE